EAPWLAARAMLARDGTPPLRRQALRAPRSLRRREQGVVDRPARARARAARARRLHEPGLDAVHLHALVSAPARDHWISISARRSCAQPLSSWPLARSSPIERTFTRL